MSKEDLANGLLRIGDPAQIWRCYEGEIENKLDKNKQQIKETLSGLAGEKNAKKNTLRK